MRVGLFVFATAFGVASGLGCSRLSLVDDDLPSEPQDGSSGSSDSGGSSSSGGSNGSSSSSGSSGSSSSGGSSGSNGSSGSSGSGSVEGGPIDAGSQHDASPDIHFQSAYSPLDLAANCPPTCDTTSVCVDKWHREDLREIVRGQLRLPGEHVLLHSSDRRNGRLSGRRIHGAHAWATLPLRNKRHDGKRMPRRLLAGLGYFGHSGRTKRLHAMT